MKTRKSKGRLVAQLRKVIGKSQSQFAAMVGVSKHTIIAVENGRNQLSEKLGSRIWLATGAHILDKEFRFEYTEAPAHEGRHQLTPEAVNFIHSRGRGVGTDDQLYTRQDFEQWRANFYPSNEETARRHFDKIKQWVELIFRAAAQPGTAGNRDRLPAVYQSLVEWLNETRENFKLEKEIDEILDRETRCISPAAYSIPSFKNPANREQIKQDLASYGHDFTEVNKSLKKAAPGDWIVLETECRQGWDPFNGTRILLCKTRKLLPKPKFWLEFGYDFMERTMNLPVEEMFKHHPEILANVETMRRKSREAARKRSETRPKS